MSFQKIQGRFDPSFSPFLGRNVELIIEGLEETFSGVLVFAGKSPLQLARNLTTFTVTLGRTPHVFTREQFNNIQVVEIEAPEPIGEPCQN